MERVLGKPPSPSSSFGNSVRHSSQETITICFLKVLGSRWEIFENGDQGSTQNFAADVVSIVVWPGEHFLGKISKFQEMHTFPKWACPQFPEIVSFLNLAFGSLKTPLYLVAPCGAFVPEELQFLEKLDVPILRSCAFLES